MKSTSWPRIYTDSHGSKNQIYFVCRFRTSFSLRPLRIFSAISAVKSFKDFKRKVRKEHQTKTSVTIHASRWPGFVFPLLAQPVPQCPSPPQDAPLPERHRSSAKGAADLPAERKSYPPARLHRVSSLPQRQRLRRAPALRHFAVDDHPRPEEREQIPRASLLQRSPLRYWPLTGTKSNPRAQKIPACRQ